MNIGIIDADMIGRTKHRFPNLVCMKLSGYYKNRECQVDLLCDYNRIPDYDKVFISKVFTDTPFPLDVNNLPDNVSIGGTGFYFDKAPNLPDEIEHHMPDYHLYDEWVNEQINNGAKPIEFKGYTDYSIGFTTRGCFRKCPFCVNQKYDKVFCHSPLEEFYDPSRKKICLLDDNILGYPKWREIFEMLQATGKKFKFKQGMDERILTDEKCKVLFASKYDGDITFAFDNIADYDLIHRKLELIRKHTERQVMFYVLVGFESTDIQDVINMFERIALLQKYHCLPYIMRYQSKEEAPWQNSEYRSMYISVARWCNQPSFFKKKSFREFCELDQSGIKTTGKLSASMRALIDIEKNYPEIAKKYFELKW